MRSSPAAAVDRDIRLGPAATVTREDTSPRHAAEKSEDGEDRHQPNDLQGDPDEDVPRSLVASGLPVDFRVNLAVPLPNDPFGIAFHRAKVCSGRSAETRTFTALAA